MKVVREFKINKVFWDAIVSGEKKYEYRKWSYAIRFGWYKFIETETNELLGYLKLQPLWVFNINEEFSEEHKETEKWVKQNYEGKHKFVKMLIFARVKPDGIHLF